VKKLAQVVHYETNHEGLSSYFSSSATNNNLRNTVRSEGEKRLIFLLWAYFQGVVMRIVYFNALLGGVMTPSPPLHVLEFAHGLVPVFTLPDISVLVAENTGKTTASTSNRMFTYFASYYRTKQSVISP